MCIYHTPNPIMTSTSGVNAPDVVADVAPAVAVAAGKNPKVRKRPVRTPDQVSACAQAVQQAVKMLGDEFIAERCEDACLQALDGLAFTCTKHPTGTGKFDWRHEGLAVIDLTGETLPDGESCCLWNNEYYSTSGLVEHLQIVPKEGDSPLRAFIITKFAISLGKFIASVSNMQQAEVDAEVTPNPVMSSAQAQNAAREEINTYNAKVGYKRRRVVANKEANMRNMTDPLDMRDIRTLRDPGDDRAPTRPSLGPPGILPLVCEPSTAQLVRRLGTEFDALRRHSNAFEIQLDKLRTMLD